MIFAAPCFLGEKNKWTIDVPNRLEFLEIPGGSQSTAVVLLHGYGANGHDLFPLPEALGISRDIHWYFPHGTLSCSVGEVWGGGRMWFPIDESGFEQTVAEGEIEGAFSSRSLEFEKSIRMMDEFIDGIAGKHTQIILGGFSQGAMISFHSAFRRNDVDKLLMLSGILIGDTASFEKKEFTVFQAHGRNDPVLPFSCALNLKNFFQEKGMELTFVEFDGGHEIPLLVISKLRDYLEK